MTLYNRLVQVPRILFGIFFIIFELLGEIGRPLITLLLLPLLLVEEFCRGLWNEYFGKYIHWDDFLETLLWPPYFPLVIRLRKAWFVEDMMKQTYNETLREGLVSGQLPPWQRKKIAQSLDRYDETMELCKK